MSDKPLVFTESEQINIRNLEQSGKELSEFRNLVIKSQFQGNDAPCVIALVNFLDGLINQTNAQLNFIKQTAQTRASTPAKTEETSTAPKSEEKSHGKKTK